MLIYLANSFKEMHDYNCISLIRWDYFSYFRERFHPSGARFAEGGAIETALDHEGSAQKWPGSTTAVPANDRIGAKPSV